ncbi:TPA: tRNA-intron lyase [Candidatus Woesearchaeota archaeon]|nr:tRNA-intron lyase [Candidatus Woesearchaeota archaeon]
MLKVQAKLYGGNVLSEASNEARELYNKNRFGALKKDNVILSLFEAFYLIEKDRLAIKENNKELSEDSFLKKAKRQIKNFQVKYAVFKDLRDRGYIVKTALKFGADFRVYDKGIQPGQDHAKWIVFPVHESETMTWHEFSAKNRVAHSTKKKLLIGIVDDECDVTYYIIDWKRP